MSINTCKNEKVSHNSKTLCIDGVKIKWYSLDTTVSTMDYAVGLIHKGCEPWTVVSADKQTSGRGTHGRSWFSPAGKGFWLSVILPPPRNAEYLDNLSVLAAKALIESLKEFTELQFDIKYPNDIIVNGRKIAGILCESISRGQDVLSVVLGMGINFNQSVKDFERKGLNEATSFLIETGYTPDTEHFLTAFLGHFKPEYEKSVLKAGGINI